MPLFFKPRKLPLSHLEKKITRPNGIVEEGLIAGITAIAGTGPRFVVEFGAGDGHNHSFARNLVENHGYGALLIEGDPVLAGKLNGKYAGNSQVATLESFVTKENIESLFRAHGVPPEPDVLVIDIDGNDYHLWEAIRSFRPNVVCIEFNPSFPPPELFILPYQEDFGWAGDDYYGASMQALVDLGKTKGYELIHCTSGGDNLFFVKKELFPMFGIGNNSPAAMYQLPRYGRFGRAANGKGHPTSARNSSLRQRLKNKTRYYFLSVFRKL